MKQALARTEKWRGFLEGNKWIYFDAYLYSRTHFHGRQPKLLLLSPAAADFACTFKRLTFSV